MVYFEIKTKNNGLLGITAIAMENRKVIEELQILGQEKDSVLRFAEFLKKHNSFVGQRNTIINQVNIIRAVSFSSGILCISLFSKYGINIAFDREYQYDVDLKSCLKTFCSYLGIQGLSRKKVFEYFELKDNGVSSLYELSQKIFEASSKMDMTAEQCKTICKNMECIVTQNNYPVLYTTQFENDLIRLFYSDKDMYLNMLNYCFEHTEEKAKDDWARILRGIENIIKKNFDSKIVKEFLECLPKTVQEIYPIELTCNILDGEGRVGANLLEINYKNTRLLVECGLELEPSVYGQEIRNNLLNKRYDACFVTHYHMDHAGMIEQIAKKTQVYIGKKAKLLLPHSSKLNLDKIKDYEKPVAIGEITVRAYLCDHSAFDSYMLEFEANGKKILYTGDFRSSGRKSFDYLLTKLPKNIEMLICEHTNDYDKEVYAEQKIQEKLANLMQTDNDVYVLCSTTNIDRIVSIYKACNQNKRVLYVDYTQAKILNDLGGAIPHPRSHKNIKILNKKYKDIMQSKENYVFLVRATMVDICRELLKNRKKATFVYSMWKGYLEGEKENEQIKEFVNMFKNNNIPVYNLHTSGHATNKDIQKLIETTNPKQIKYVHGNLI